MDDLHMNITGNVHRVEPCLLAHRPGDNTVCLDVFPLIFIIIGVKYSNESFAGKSERSLIYEDTLTNSGCLHYQI